jgi:hypothetical protein
VLCLRYSRAAQETAQARNRSVGEPAEGSLPKVLLKPEGRTGLAVKGLMRLRCVSQPNGCLQSCASSTAVPRLSVRIHVAPCIASFLGLGKGKRSQKDRNKQTNTNERKKRKKLFLLFEKKSSHKKEAPLLATAGAACTAARNTENRSSNLRPPVTRDKLGSALRTCKRHAAGTHRLRRQPSGPKRWCLAARHCGHSGAMMGSLGRLLLLSLPLVAAALCCPGLSSRSASESPPAAFACILLRAVRSVALESCRPPFMVVRVTGGCRLSTNNLYRLSVPVRFRFFRPLAPAAGHSAHAPSPFFHSPLLSREERATTWGRLCSTASQRAIVERLRIFFVQ